MSDESTTSLRTGRLRLNRPEATDLGALAEICADPRVWTAFPSLRHRDPAQTAAMIDRWQTSWVQAGLGTWTIRLGHDGTVIGYGGCSLMHGEVWNLGYRLDADSHGMGYATELSAAAIDAARRVDPSKPIIAYLLENNHASARVAQKVGLTLEHRGPDAGNPDASAVRLVFADRPLTPPQVAAATR